MLILVLEIRGVGVGVANRMSNTSHIFSYIDYRALFKTAHASRLTPSLPPIRAEA